MSRLASLARVATLALALAPLAGVAYADDEYNTGHAAVIAQAALSQPAAPLSANQVATLNDAFKVGQNDAFGGATSSQLRRSPWAARRASPRSRARSARPTSSARAARRTRWRSRPITPAAAPISNARDVAGAALQPRRPPAFS